MDPSLRDKPDGCHPFCSERCRLIDLGRWLGEKYRIPLEDEQADGDHFPPDENEQ
jgi:endogenous inhibitor of DNA gyrase (YacG/DUF329 family)